MGGLFSSIRYALNTIKTLVDGAETLSKRIARSPGIPQLNSSVPYWTIPPSPIAQHGKDMDILLHADVVIVGSGISGTAIAKALLEHVRDSKPVQPLRVVMLEARDACSGATGRNGGHIVPNVYTEYFELKKTYGAGTAREILRFRLAHISTLINVAKEEDLLEESQARLVDDFDAFLHPDMFDKAVTVLESYLLDVPKDLADGFDIIKERETIDELQLAKSIYGCILKPGASIHPYRLVTGLLQKLLVRHSNFQLFTRTPCSNITSNTNGGTYTVHTPRGEIKTRHVIHATNAWSSHLLPGMRTRIIPTRLHMSTQRPGQGLMPTKTHATSNWAGSRGFVFYSNNQDFTSGKLQHEFSFDYLTQLKPASNNTPGTFLPTAGEFMFGGGAMLGGRSMETLLANIGIADDSSSDPQIEQYLHGSLQSYFGSHWGQEGTDPDTAVKSGLSWGEGRVKTSWTGIIAVSADMQPWVGRVPASISGRREPRPVISSPHHLSPEAFDKPEANSDVLSLSSTAAPGEWICAGYTGEGMVHAWLSGQAVAKMVLGVADDEKATPGDTYKLPAPFLISEKRVKAARIEDIM